MRNSEIRHDDPLVFAHEQVLGLQVTMDDTLQVRRLYTVQNVTEHSEDLILRDAVLHVLPQRGSEQRHDVEGEVLRPVCVDALINNSDNAIVLISAAECQFILEPLSLVRVGVAKEFQREHLAVSISHSKDSPAPPVTDAAAGGVRVRCCFKDHLCHGCSQAMHNIWQPYWGCHVDEKLVEWSATIPLGIGGNACSERER